VEIETHRQEILFRGSAQKMCENNTESGLRDGVKDEDIRMQKGMENIISHFRI
jgi:hypothetical protein